MIINRVTATVKRGKLNDYVILMQTEARALQYRISRICTVLPEDDSEEVAEHDGVVVFDVDFPDLDSLAAWKANIGAPDNKHFFDAWSEMIVDASYQTLETHD